MCVMTVIRVLGSNVNSWDVLVQKLIDANDYLDVTTKAQIFLKSSVFVKLHFENQNYSL